MQRSNNNDFSITTGRDGSRTFGEHDDRWAPRGRGNNRRKFHNKNYGKGPFRGRGRGRGASSYGNQASGSDYVDPEGDIMMGGDADQGPQRRFNPYGARPKSKHSRRGDQYQKHNRSNQHHHGGDVSGLRRMGLPIHNSGKTWFRISIPHAKQVDKATLLSLLGNRIPGNFRPIQLQYKGEMALFYVDDKDTADILKGMNRSITLPGSNLKLMINVQISSPPFPVMNDENMDKLKVVMSARYDPSIKALDLTALYEDKSLQQEGLFLPLNRPVIATCAAKIIEQNIPELERLNLSDNRMLSLSSVQEMVSRAPNVTSLNLGRNQLRSIEELDKIKGWQLTELTLDKNPLCDKIKSQTEFVSVVRKRFPKVVKLDGKDLPPPITFDIGTAVLPPSQGSYFVNSEVQDLVVKFLKEFYTLYDSDNRQPLIDAYHENALFSLSVAPNPVIESKQPFLGDYFPSSRNEFRIKGRDERDIARARDRLLKKGRLQVVSELCSLAKTTHDANSFVVDVNLLSSTVLSFVVNGLFKESDKADKPPIRAFSRNFIAIPASGGVLLINDSLTITNASPEQQRVAFKSTGPTPSSSPVSSNPPVLTSPVPGTSGAAPPVAASPQQQLESLSAERQQMVLSFSQESNMNPIFSFRCLDDNGWDYSKAGQMFLSLQAEGKVPPEAFVK